MNILKNLEELETSLKHLTSFNNHTGALIAIAKACRFDSYAKMFQAVQTLQDIHFHIPQELLTYREIQAKAMLDYLKMEYGEIVYNRIKMCL